MSNWDRMDKIAWNNSEVFHEYEKLLAEAALSLNLQVEAQEDISKKLDTINKGVESTSQKVGDFIELAKNLADDDLKPEEDKVPTEEEQHVAKAKLLEELNQLAIEASSSSNYKLAYKIERAIDFISEV